MNINKSFDFEKFDLKQISGMNNLIEIVTEDEEFSKRLFTVEIIYRDKEKVHIPSRGENKFTFGKRTVNDKFKRNNVDIRIFDDFIEFADGQNGPILPLSVRTKGL